MRRSVLKRVFDLVGFSPYLWISCLFAVCIGLVSIMIPTLFRIMIDFGVVGQDRKLFQNCVWGVVAGTAVVALLRCGLRFCQNSASDFFKMKLRMLVLERKISVMRRTAGQTYADLEGLPREDLRRIAEFMGFELAFVIAGGVHVVLMTWALIQLVGPVALSIVLLCLAFRFLDAVLAAREVPFVAGRSDGMKKLDQLEHYFSAAGPTFFGLDLKGLCFARMRRTKQLVNERLVKLHETQFKHDLVTRLTAEFAFASSCVVAGVFAFSGKITFGEFTFVVIALAQLQSPVSLLMHAFFHHIKLQPAMQRVLQVLHAAEKKDLSHGPRLGASVRMLDAVWESKSVALSGPVESGKTSVVLNWYQELLRSQPSMRVAFVPRNPKPFPISMSASDYLPQCDPAPRCVSQLGLSEIFNAGRVAETLNEVELRCLLLARAICSEPEVLILDEPEMGMDRRMREGVRDVLAEVIRDGKIFVILISHDEELLQQCRDWINLDVNARKAA